MTIEIRGGGVVAVDTESLRAASARWRTLADAARGVQRALEQASGSMHAAGAYGNVEYLRRVVTEGCDRADRHADDLSHVALLYEIVEERAALASARQAGGEGLIAQHETRLANLESQAFAAGLGASMLEAQWGVGRYAGVAGQFVYTTAQLGVLAPWFGTLSFGALAAVHLMGLGRVGAGDRLEPTAEQVWVDRLEEKGGTAPGGVASLVDRMPGGEGSRIRVEIYTMPNGEREVLVYTTGTQQWGLPGSDPFDVQSNLETYGGQESGSYLALEQALEDAGVTKDDGIHLIGHSQGAMVNARFAAQTDYRVETAVSMGNGLAVELPGHVLSVTLRHTDDIVPALTDGGFGHTTGATGSIVVERNAGLDDNVIGSHMLDEYRETAVELDASRDPRMGAVRDVFSGLAGATAVQTITYSAQRVEPKGGGRSAGGGGV